MSGTIHTGAGNIDNFSVTASPNPATITVVPNGWFWGGAADPTYFYDSPTVALRKNRIQFTGTQSYANNDLLASQADVERFVKDSVITSIQLGARYEHNKYVSQGYRTSAFGIQTQNIDSNFLIQSPTADDLFGGNGGRRRPIGR